MSQIKQVKHYLESGGKLTPIDALDKFRCFRLAAVVHNLREGGLDVKTKIVKNGKKSYAEYYLENLKENKDQYGLFGAKK
tara:strand:+ start:308 stop:547 length:240 start_codon:yes stop_codon:yes gene_type:complete